MAARSATAASSSSAYELESIGAIPEIPLERPREIPRERYDGRRRVEVSEETEEKIKQRARARTVAKNRQYISVFAIVGSITAVVLIVLVIFSYIQLAVLTDETAKLETELQEVAETNESLSVEYDNEFNLTYLEDYAKNILGMAEPAEGQVYYLENGLKDEASVLDKSVIKDYGILSAITSFFSSLME